MAASQAVWRVFDFRRPHDDRLGMKLGGGGRHGMETSPKPRARAWIPALIGLGVIVGGFIISSSVDFLFMGQDPAGKAMAAGFAFFAFAVVGLVFLIVAVIVAIRNRVRSTS